MNTVIHALSLKQFKNIYLQIISLIEKSQTLSSLTFDVLLSVKSVFSLAP